jgi:pimeloyl-ACP methyl ester carboxylesterase
MPIQFSPNALNAAVEEGERGAIRFRMAHPICQGVAEIDEASPRAANASSRRKMRAKRRYQRIVLDGVGHFPQRESPLAVATAIVQHLAIPAGAQNHRPFWCR